MNKIKCIDLFCGVGGLTYGLNKSGVNVIAGYDLDDECKYPYETNNSAIFIKQDVKTLKASDIKKQLNGHCGPVLLAGCAPCQPFSTYSQRYKNIGTDRWALLYQFARLIKELLPDYIVMENVPRVTKHVVFDDFEKSIKALGYHLTIKTVDCSEYGLPQTRKRTVLIASLHGEIDLPEGHSNKMSVRDAIGQLPEIYAGNKNNRDPLHISPKLSELNLRRIIASKPGGSWRDWPKEIIAECHNKKSGKTYVSVYGRMEWDKPSPSLTTQFYGFGNGRYGHPEQNRAISLREGAILQGFPANYKFVKYEDKIGFKSLGRLIGNAVPVQLGEMIGRTLVDHCEKSFVKTNTTETKRKITIAAE